MCLTFTNTKLKKDLSLRKRSQPEEACKEANALSLHCKHEKNTDCLKLKHSCRKGYMYLGKLCYPFAQFGLFYTVCIREGQGQQRYLEKKMRGTSSAWSKHKVAGGGVWEGQDSR